ncbi:MAG: hypothetical protein M3481_07350 [Actinomycetota bacterium]|nr:hypothetical protein [Actinomycetota bacterium]
MRGCARSGGHGGHGPRGRGHDRRRGPQQRAHRAGGGARPLLGRASRPRRARDERLQRRAGRAAVSAGELAWTSCTSSRSGAR